jgi:hypothetical protein
MTVDILKNYPNEVFVETGTYKGDGIQMALDCGFKAIYSFEGSEELALIAGKRFINDKRVAIFRADSRENIRHIIEQISCPITFWLDAHPCGIAYFEKVNGSYNEIPTYEGGKTILAELNQIDNHPIKNHTILIDDWTIFGTREIETKLWDMGYNTEFIDGTRKQDILIAKK